MGSIDRKARNQVRKAEKSELTVRRGGAELLPISIACSHGHARSGRRLRAEVFAEVMAAFTERARLIVVRLKARPCSAGLTYRNRNMIEIPWPRRSGTSTASSQSSDLLALYRNGRR